MPEKKRIGNGENAITLLDFIRWPRTEHFGHWFSNVGI